MAHTLLSGYSIYRISGFLMLYLHQNQIGYALVSGEYGMPDNHENVVIPNLSFIVKERGALVRSGPAPFMPDLAIEAQSEGQSDKFMIDKAHLYLDNGTRMVWIIYSTKKLVEVLTLTDRQLLTLTDTLDGGDVLPGFSLPVAEIFVK